MLILMLLTALLAPLLPTRHVAPGSTPPTRHRTLAYRAKAPLGYPAKTPTWPAPTRVVAPKSPVLYAPAARGWRSAKAPVWTASNAARTYSRPRWGGLAARPQLAKCGPALGQLPPVTSPAPLRQTPAEQPVLAARPETLAEVTITGLVLTNDGMPVPGVEVYLANAPHQRCITNAEGAFYLKTPTCPALQVVADYHNTSTRQAIVNPFHPQPLFLTVAN
ncbi:hypothetical protein GKZ68_21590 (plasmid) [Hymenobacter sp. BRD128]|uniref:hypothetical protein n=1 Tax=Hymenobacter sp. BRD128 TaxID=2675878 RepID=UPI0015647707|nr:hypothetical protein [Hymenobacter sp. BRD128]QKG59275.1 hypothetical protein GKZ68_21590 [Hymenobacter sp. BRD128]